VKTLLNCIAIASLVGLLIVPLLFFAQVISLDQNKTYLLIGTLFWFGSTGMNFFLREKKPEL
jgi:Na+/melibiose symporter-like transporter